MGLEAYEVARLALAITALIFALSFYKKLRDRPGSLAFVVAVAAVYASYAFTVIESVFAHDVVNVLQHASYAVAGIAAGVAAWQQRRGVIATRGRG